MTIDDCRFVAVATHSDARGSLGVVESGIDVPFSFRRFYYIYGSSGATRGQHAHRQLHQLLIPLSGSLVVRVDDGRRSSTYELNRPDRALYIGPLIWREMMEISKDCVCGVLASEHYDAQDYLRDYDEFRKLAVDQ